MDKRVCNLCQGDLLALPLPHPARAMLSDGRCLDLPLAKTACVNCGLVAHARQLQDADIRGVYGEEYALAEASPAADAARARAYAGALTRLLSPARRVLEIGCGSGALTRKLHEDWPQAALVGLDPAVPDGATTAGHIEFRRGFFEAFAPDEEKFDLIFSVNVIEHVADPADFFARAADLLAPGGRLAMFCPASVPPNLELLFHDHLHTFSAVALARLAASAGFATQLQLDRVEGLGDFQFLVFARDDDAVPLATFPADAGAALARDRAAYMQAWSALEATLCERTAAAARVVLFGGGQMAALLRAYAPALWARADMLVMDNAGDAWAFDKPVREYAQLREDLRGAAVVIATAPSAHAFLANRLAADGLVPVRFDDLISC